MKKEEALKRLALIESEVHELQAIVNQNDNDDKTKQMQDFLLKIVNGLELKIVDGCPTYYKGNEWVFQQDFKNGRLWVRYSIVWSVFETKFGLSCSSETRHFIKTWVESNLNWEGLTPFLSSLTHHNSFNG